MDKQIRVGGFDGGAIVLQPGENITWHWPDGTKILCLNDDGVLIPVRLTKTEEKQYDYQPAEPPYRCVCGAALTKLGYCSDCVP